MLQTQSTGINNVTNPFPREHFLHEPRLGSGKAGDQRELPSTRMALMDLRECRLVDGKKRLEERGPRQRTRK